MEGGAIRLNWTLPRIRVDRSALKEIRRTEVYRRIENGAPEEPVRPALLVFGGLFGPPPGVPGFERVADITVAEPGTAQVQGNQVTYTDAQGLTFGQRYTYVVVALDEQGRPSPPSNRVVVALAAAPGRAAAHGGPARRHAGAPHLGRAGHAGGRIAGAAGSRLRRVPGDDARHAGGRPLNLEPVTTRQYVDLAVQNDVTYHYAVRARLGTRRRPERAERRRQPRRRRTPPRPPSRGASWRCSPGSTVRLAWQAVPEADLAGYLVYRSTTAGRGHVRLSAAPQGATTYVDADVRPGQTYFYVVTAVDRSKRANESVPSPEASATLP